MTERVCIISGKEKRIDMSLGKRKLHEQVRLRIYGDELIFGPGIAQIMELVEKTGSLSDMQAVQRKGRQNLLPPKLRQ